MASIFDTLITSIRAHWKAHDNKYPQAIRLTPAQVDELMRLRRVGSSKPGSIVDRTTFLGAKIEEDAATPGVIVAVDGTETAL